LGWLRGAEDEEEVIQRIKGSTECKRLPAPHYADCSGLVIS